NAADREGKLTDRVFQAPQIKVFADQLKGARPVQHVHGRGDANRGVQAYGPSRPRLFSSFVLVLVRVIGPRVARFPRHAEGRGPDPENEERERGGAASGASSGGCFRGYFPGSGFRGFRGWWVTAQASLPSGK